MFKLSITNTHADGRKEEFVIVEADGANILRVNGLICNRCQKPLARAAQSVFMCPSGCEDGGMLTVGAPVA